MVKQSFFSDEITILAPMMAGGFILWQTQIGSIHTPEGHLDESMELFRTMKISLRPNEIWVWQLTDLITGLYQQQTSNIRKIGIFFKTIQPDAGPFKGTENA